MHGIPPWNKEKVDIDYKKVDIEMEKVYIGNEMMFCTNL